MKCKTCGQTLAFRRGDKAMNQSYGLCIVIDVFPHSNTVQVIRWENGDTVYIPAELLRIVHGTIKFLP